MAKIKIAMDSQILTSLMTCPRKTDLRFNRNLVSKHGKSNALECGSLAHTILEFYNKAIISGTNRTNAIDIGISAGIEYTRPYRNENKYIKDESHKGLVNTPEESGKDQYGKERIGIKHVFATMDEFFDYTRNDSNPVLAAEEVRGDVIYEDDDLIVLWKAKFDVIIDTNAGMCSKDYKTESMRSDPLELDNQFIGQTRLLKGRNMLIQKIGWQKSLKAPEKFRLETISYSVDRIAEWCNEIVPHYARMLIAYDAANNWPAQFTGCKRFFLCEYYKEICNVDRGMREESMKIFFDQGKVWDITND